MVLSAYVVPGQGQPKQFWQALSLEINGHHGFLIANQPKSQYLRTSHASFVEMTLTAQTTGIKNWQVENHYPKIGIGLLYGSPGSDKYLGKLAAIYPFMHFTLLRRHGVNCSFRLGMGAAWVEKTYDKTSNYKNMMISTHVNGCVSMMLVSEVLLSKQFSIEGGISFTHLSNGSIKLPNLGLNLPAASLGMRYQFNPPPPLAKKQLAPFRKKWNFYVYALLAAKQTYPLESPIYLVRILTAEILRDFARNGRYGAGINVSHDRSLSREESYAPVYSFDKSSPQFQVSLYGCYEHVIGRLSIPLQFGIYAYNKYPVNAVYENIGIKYRFSNHVNAVVQLKAHSGKADYLQCGFGYKF